MYIKIVSRRHSYICSWCAESIPKMRHLSCWQQCIIKKGDWIFLNFLSFNLELPRLLRCTRSPGNFRSYFAFYSTDMFSIWTVSGSRCNLYLTRICGLECLVYHMSQKSIYLHYAFFWVTNKALEIAAIDWVHDGDPSCGSILA
jgi:hypothetical protein